MMNREMLKDDVAIQRRSGIAIVITSGIVEVVRSDVYSVIHRASARMAARESSGAGKGKEYF